MHTARHIVKNCFQGTLAQDRTIILVTHHISLCLPMSNYLVELSRGKVARQGTINELQEQGVLEEVVHDEDISNLDQPSSDEEEESSTDVDTERIQKKLVQEEYRKEGRIGARTYFNYFKTSGLLTWALTILLMALMRLATIANSVRWYTSGLT